MRKKKRIFGLVAVLFMLGNWKMGQAAEINGIYTEPATKDLGVVTGVKALEGIKVRGWISTYYDYNTNDPSNEVVNCLQDQGSSPNCPTLNPTGATSVVKGRHIDIEGRTFDVHNNSFSLELAELEVEKVPGMGGVGFKFDMAFGDTQDIIVDTIKARIGVQEATDFISDFDKTFQHASVGYVAPVGRGLRFDMGKFVTHIGGETIAGIKNNNFSHAFFYTYAIPFQDTGIRINYSWTDTFYTELYVLNGWNVTTDNNSGKTIGPSIGWTFGPFSWYLNYLAGPEQANNNSNLRQLIDTQLFLSLGALNLALNYDMGTEENALDTDGDGVADDVSWNGITGWVRYRVTEAFEPSLRVEWYNDEDGFTTGLKQKLTGITLTLNYRLGQGADHILVRPEYRYDRSDEKFFSKDDEARSEKTQQTVGINFVYYF